MAPSTKAALLVCIAAACLSAARGTARAGTEALVYSFSSNGDGAQPHAALVNVKGKLFGTTQVQGTNNAGSVFRISPSGALTLVHAFGNAGDGQQPVASVVAVSGVLYGTTLTGGANGDGTVFKTTLAGTETVLHSFAYGTTDGRSPAAGLIPVGKLFYGTTTAGGAGGGGTVFSMTKAGAVTLLHSFPNATGDGSVPMAGLVAVNGILWGTTAQGGANGVGTIFSITPAGAYSVVHSFAGSDGSSPLAALIDVGGTLYGTTEYGGANEAGTVFKITKAGAVSVLYAFQGGANDGALPTSGLIDVGGVLYGTTRSGGPGNRGTVYGVAVSGAESLVHAFAGGQTDGQDPEAGLAKVRGTLYGTTTEGGAAGVGTVFSITP